MSKTRDGAKVIKKHDVAKTPFQRPLARDAIPRSTKDNLTRWYEQLNPAQIRRDIATLQQRLFDSSAARGHPNR